MANLPPVLRQRYFDANGNPLAGGKLYTYQAGTTTPQPTYTDSSGETPNENPVVLDANGEAAVWLDPELSYKFVLNDADDNLQWTVDGVIGLVTADAVGSASIQDGAVTASKLGESALDLFDYTRPSIVFNVVGILNAALGDGILHEPIRHSLSLTGVRLIVLNAGTEGTVTVDIEYKRGSEEWSTILSTPISSDYDDGDYHTEEGALSVTSLQPGDLLRLNVDSVQTAMEDFLVIVDYEVN